MVEQLAILAWSLQLWRANFVDYLIDVHNACVERALILPLSRLLAIVRLW